MNWNGPCPPRFAFSSRRAVPPLGQILPGVVLARMVVGCKRAPQVEIVLFEASRVRTFADDCAALLIPVRMLAQHHNRDLGIPVLTGRYTPPSWACILCVNHHGLDPQASSDAASWTLRQVARFGRVLVAGAGL